MYQKYLDSIKPWHTLSLLAITLTFSMSTWFSASAIIPQLRDEWVLSINTSAWLTIAVQLGFVMGAVLSSVFNISDLISPRHVIFIGSLGASIANVFLVISDGPIVGIPLRFATGFFLAGVYPPSFKLISTWYKEGRGKALGILGAAILLGNASPHLINGLGGLDWPLVIYGTSLLTFTGGFVAEFAIKEGPYPFPKATFDPRQIGYIFRDRGVRLASIGYFGHMWELFAMYAWFGVYLSDFLTAKNIGVGSIAAFAMFTIMAIGGVGSWIGGILADRWGRIRTIILMMSVSGSCAILIGFLFNSPIWIVLIIGLLWGFTIVPDSPQFSTLVTELGDQKYIGTALTLQLALGFSITVATIWLIPGLEDAFGWRWAFAFLAPGPIAGIIAMLRLRSLPEAEQVAGGHG
jgi:MFS family permease